jgi:hypothetical protein
MVVYVSSHRDTKMKNGNIVTANQVFRAAFSVTIRSAIFRALMVDRVVTITLRQAIRIPMITA